MLKENYMKENPLISLIVPVYNVQEYLDKCVESIVNQTYTNLEIILVDDGSTDNSGRKCDAWAAKDDRIKVVHKVNGGLGNARNVGMGYASGVWIGFVDSDDFIEKNMYERLYNACTEYSADLGVTSFSFFRDGQYQPFHKHTCKVEVYEGLEWIDEYYGKNKCGHIVPSAWSKLYKRELIIDKKFSEGRYFEDIMVAAKVLNDANKIVYIDDGLYIYRKDRGESITESTLDRKKINDSIDLHLEEIEFLQSCGYHKMAHTLLEELHYEWIIQMMLCSIKKTCSKDTIRHMRFRAREIYGLLQMQEHGLRLIGALVHYIKGIRVLIRKIIKHLVK